MDKAKKINKNKIQKQTQIKNQKKQTKTQSKKLSKMIYIFAKPIINYSRRFIYF